MGGRTLVLGGGGITGIAWEIGMLAGLAKAGVDLTDADTVIGTSAGSVTGAQLTSGTDIEELFRRQLRQPGAEVPARLDRAMLARFLWAAAVERDPARFRARLGLIATRTAAAAGAADRRAVIAARLPVHTWPERDLRVTAVDARTGALTVFTGADGEPLVDAVAASCAVPGVWPPVDVNGRTYIDGGVYAAANAHLAAGSERVVVLAPIARGAGPMPSAAGQLADLPSGTRSVLAVPDPAAVAAFGPNVLDPAFRAAAARAGRAQAADEALAIARVWGD